MIQKYRNIINSINDSMGPKAERCILLAGHLIIGGPFYCLLLLLHIRFAGLKKDDHDIATTFLPLFIFSELLFYLWIFFPSMWGLEFGVPLRAIAFFYTLLVLVLDIIAKTEWDPRIRFKLIPIRASLYSRKFSNKQNYKNNKGDRIENN